MPHPSPQSFKPSDMVSSLFWYGTNDENLIDYMISFLIGSIIHMAYTFIKQWCYEILVTSLFNKK